MIVVYFGIGWFMGIWLASAVSFKLAGWPMVAGVGVVTAVLSRKFPQWRWLGIGIVAVGLGAARYVTAVPTITDSHIAYYNDSSELTFTGLVSAEPDVRDRFTNLRVTVDTITLPDGVTQPAHGTVLIRAFRYPEIPYGAQVEVTGRPETPPEFEDFSYKDYLARQGIHSLLNTPQLTVLAENQGSPVKQAIFAFKARAQNTINQLIPDPQAALLSGILLGNDNGLSPELADAFRTTGMTHIIAISGFNIAILIAIMVSISEPLLGKRGSVAFAVAGVTLYTILVGADASVVRAAIMGSIYLLAGRLLGRPNFAYASLFLAGILMTIINPFTLWDVGFQLSFTATLGLMLYADPFTQWTRARLLRWLDRDAVRRVMGLISESVLITLAAQVLTLPLMMMVYFIDCHSSACQPMRLFCRPSRDDLPRATGDWW
ncbi:MAG: ComEC family competence protein [Ardenticatenaceae bacterium]|nr:ComEC family competence protein [Ardenticatenaceae bacterium]